MQGEPGQSRVFAYNGEQYTPQTGLQYLRARHYDPQLGAFTTRDTYLGDLKTPISQNRYTYAHNNPVRYADPSGHRLDVDGPRGPGTTSPGNIRDSYKPAPSRPKPSGGGSSSGGSAAPSGGGGGGGDGGGGHEEPPYDPYQFVRLYYKSLVAKKTAHTGQNSMTLQQYKTALKTTASQTVKQKETAKGSWWDSTINSAKGLVESAVQQASSFYQKHKVGINIALGAATIIGATALTIATAGSAAPVIALTAKLALVGSVAGGSAGAIVGGVSAAISGKNVGEAVAEGFGSGAVSGAVSGALAATAVGRGGQIIGNAAISTTSYATQTTLNGGQISAAGVTVAFIGGVVAGAVGGPGATSAGRPYNQVIDHTVQSIAREARRANVEYAAKQVARTTEYFVEKTVELVAKETQSILQGALVGGFANEMAGKV